MSPKNKAKYLIDAYPELLSGVDSLIKKSRTSDFEPVKLSDKEKSLLKKAKEICEFLIIKFLDDKDSKKLKALCSVYLDVVKLLDEKKDCDKQGVYEYIKIITFGYLTGEKHINQEYLQRILKTFDNCDPQEWNKKLLLSINKAIIFLIKQEPAKTIQLIEELRSLQNNYEIDYLYSLPKKLRPQAAAELIALYNLARSVEIPAEFIITKKNLDLKKKIKHHIDTTKELSDKAGNIFLFLSSLWIEKLLFVFLDKEVN